MDLNVPLVQGLHPRVVAGREADAIRVAHSRLTEILQVDPERVRTGAVHRRGAENGRRRPVAATGQDVNADRMDVQVGYGSMVLVLLLPLRTRGRDHRVAAERRLVTIRRRDPATVGDLAAGSARRQ